MIMNGVARFLLCEGFDESILRLYRHFRLRFALAIETSGSLRWCCVITSFQL